MGGFVLAGAWIFAMLALSAFIGAAFYDGILDFWRHF